jgi:protein-S-isoprenylcysteine O-methyltransferase Ste14
MTLASNQQDQQPQADTTGLVRVGGWLFRRRTLTPVPFFVALLFVRAGEASPSLPLTAAGIAVVALSEGLRLWGVQHIGAISRTRSDRLGPLVAGGPFALVRNPLYLGNIGLWIGFAISARLLWMAPVIAIILAFEYHAIVRWEERLLESRLGGRYRAYTARVPRWIPRIAAPAPAPAASAYSWRETFFSERGTLIAIGTGYVLLWIKLKS